MDTLDSLITLIDLLFTIFFVLVVCRLFFDWFRVNTAHALLGVVFYISYQLTEPIVAPVRQLLQIIGLPDASLMITIFGAAFLRTVLTILAVWLLHI